jgi:hypothetical protein
MGIDAAHDSGAMNVRCGATPGCAQARHARQSRTVKRSNLCSLQTSGESDPFYVHEFNWRK